MTVEQKLNEATKSLNEARQLMNSKKHGSKAWRDAEETLNFWQGKVAMLEVMKKQNIL